MYDNVNHMFWNISVSIIFICILGSDRFASVFEYKKSRYLDFGVLPLNATFYVQCVLSDAYLEALVGWEWKGVTRLTLSERDR